jgi:WhiB family redox-sensing transcriptional regulator
MGKTDFRSEVVTTRHRGLKSHGWNMAASGESQFMGFHIARENYLVNDHAGVLALRPDFRKLADHEQITAVVRPHALTPGSQPHRDDRHSVQGAAQNRAKLICRGCPVRTECLADALDNGIEFGVWGGMTERERRALLRRRPDVTSWRELLERARDEYERQSIDELVAS